MVRPASLASLALLLLAPPAPARAAGGADLPKEPGVYWEQTVEMQMSGFSMPGQTTKVCLPKKGLEEPPTAEQDAKCKMTDLKRSGARMSWKFKCEDGSNGEGEITSGPDRFDGKMTMRTQGNEAHMKMKGRKVGGDCDANEMKRKVATLQKQADDSRAEAARGQARMCDEAADKLQLELFAAPYPGVPVSCKDTTKLCAKVETRDGLAALKQNRAPGAREKVEKLCKKDLAPIIARHCAAAAKEQEKKLGGESTEFVFAWCPDLARSLAQRECAGRKFTALPPAQRDFCTRWAQKGLEGDDDGERQPAKAEKKKSARQVEAPDDEEAAPAKEDMKSKILKGIFGR